METLVQRPDLLMKAPLEPEDRAVLEAWQRDLEMILDKGPTKT
jgi:hypothetical protein